MSQFGLVLADEQWHWIDIGVALKHQCLNILIAMEEHPVKQVLCCDPHMFVSSLRLEFRLVKLYQLFQWKTALNVCQNQWLDDLHGFSK